MCKQRNDEGVEKRKGNQEKNEEEGGGKKSSQRHAKDTIIIHAFISHVVAHAHTHPVCILGTFKNIRINSPSGTN